MVMAVLATRWHCCIMFPPSIYIISLVFTSRINPYFQYAAIRIHQKQTGGGSLCPIKLDAAEELAISLMPESQLSGIENSIRNPQTKVKGN